MGKRPHRNRDHGRPGTRPPARHVEARRALEDALAEAELAFTGEVLVEAKAAIEAAYDEAVAEALAAQDRCEHLLAEHGGDA